MESGLTERGREAGSPGDSYHERPTLKPHAAPFARRLADPETLDPTVNAGKTVAPEWNKTVPGPSGR